MDASPPLVVIKARYGSTLAPAPADDDSKEQLDQDYDPRCGMSKEDFQWRLAQHQRVCKRIPQALHDLQIQENNMRQHFLDDLDALRIWDDYVNDVNNSFAGRFQRSLSSPLYTPNSVLYEQLMKREAHKRSFAGRLDKLKKTAVEMNKRVGKTEVMAASVLAGLVVGCTLTLLWNKQRVTKEA